MSGVIWLRSKVWASVNGRRGSRSPRIPETEGSGSRPRSARVIPLKRVLTSRMLSSGRTSTSIRTAPELSTALRRVKERPPVE